MATNFADLIYWQILGSDSGWQPIPLTDVLTAVAVKKAYRKATLCVHPDKLQQRGATIQQKYICEKVFDLLKVRFIIWRDLPQLLNVKYSHPANKLCLLITVTLNI